MKLMEYQARELFDQYGIPVMNGFVIDAVPTDERGTEGLQYPLVIKAQVQVGGRGKAGGIRFAENFDALKDISNQLLFSDLKGHRVNKLMIVEKAAGVKECYLSVTLDRLGKMPLIIFSAEGGVDIEKTAVNNPGAIVKIPVDPQIGVNRYMAQYAVNRSGLEQGLVSRLFEIMTRLYQLFLENDALLAEINPLMIREDQSLVALDGKVDVDDSALYRQPKAVAYRDELQEEELVLEARKFRFLYIPVDETGTIGVISNGSGMLMSSIDLISKAEMAVGAALDLGGGATSDRIKEAVRIMLSNEKIQYLYINIFGGITRCDEVAAGVNTAMEVQSAGKCVVVRLEGTNKEEGIRILSSSKADILSVDGLAEGVEALERKGAVS